jgi:hypothetical protein
MFHHNVTKLLFLSKRARPDIQTAVAFLCTRVREPDTDDYKKLMRCMRFLQQTTELPLVLEADGANIIKWWVDGAFTVHKDTKSHTGALMTPGKQGSCLCGLHATEVEHQKLNIGRAGWR